MVLSLRKRPFIYSILAIWVTAAVGCAGPANSNVNKETDKAIASAVDSSEVSSSSKVPKLNSLPTAESEASGSDNNTISFSQYENDRFGFSIEYPSTFIVKVIPDNNDGRIFSSVDGNAELTVSGINNVLNESADKLYNNLLKNHGNATYKVQKDNWFVVSWNEGDKIVYQKSVVGSDSINTFVIKYPVNQKDYYSSIVAKLNSSFKSATQMASGK